MPVQSLRSRSPPPTTTLAHLHSREQGSERPSGGSRGERTGCSVSRIRHWRKLCCRGRLQNLFWGGVGGRKWFAKMLATAVRRDSNPVMLLYSKEVESRKVVGHLSFVICSAVLKKVFCYVLPLHSPSARAVRRLLRPSAPPSTPPHFSSTPPLTPLTY